MSRTYCAICRKGIAFKPPAICPECGLDERITALLPKIQECAKPKIKYGRGEIFARIKWDLPKLRQVLKEGL